MQRPGVRTRERNLFDHKSDALTTTPPSHHHTWPKQKINKKDKLKHKKPINPRSEIHEFSLLGTETTEVETVCEMSLNERVKELSDQMIWSRRDSDRIARQAMDWTPPDFRRKCHAFKQ